MNALRTRMVTTGLLALVALGGAGLAVAADRPQNPGQRPELTWAADRAAQPWIDGLLQRLRAVDGQVADVARAGRSALENLQSLDIETMRGALADGERATTAADQALADLAAAQQQSAAHIERQRLGPDTLAALEAIDAAAQRVASVPALWDRIDARAALVGGLIDDLQRHDALVFRATTAGRQAHWDAALATLGDAAEPLAAASTVRDLLRGGSATDTLDEVLARYTAYDSALRALYEYLAGGGSQSDARFETLQGQVDEAQQALPSDAGVLSFIVAEAAGTDITAALIEIEQVRGAIAAGLGQ